MSWLHGRLRSSNDCHSVLVVFQGIKSGSANAKFEQQTMTNIRVPHEHDVLMGRGGKNNQHSGNEKLRCLARDRCAAYRRATKKDKSDLSRELVRLMRALDPPARYVVREPFKRCGITISQVISNNSCPDFCGRILILVYGRTLATTSLGRKLPRYSVMQFPKRMDQCRKSATPRP